MEAALGLVFSLGKDYLISLEGSSPLLSRVYQRSPISMGYTRLGIETTSLFVVSRLAQTCLVIPPSTVGVKKAKIYLAETLPFSPIDYEAGRLAHICTVLLSS